MAGTQATAECECPHCGVPAGKPCQYPSGGKTPHPHMERGKVYLEKIGREEWNRRHQRGSAS